MAIKIEVPGVNGTVTVEGAAEERTMREILDVLKERNKAEGIQTKEVNEALKDLGDNAKDAADGLKDVSANSNGLSKNLAGFGKSLAATAANVAVSFIKAYDTMAEKPIQAGAALVQAQIELNATLDKLKVDLGAKLVQAGLALFGPVTEGAQKAKESFAKFSKDVIDLGAQFYTLGNQFLAAEFEKRIKAMGDFTKAGASFGGGLTEIGLLANESGIGLANYAKAVANSRESITAMGLSAGEAAKLVAKGYRGLTSTLGSSGSMIREELLALGYDYEEQGEVMALFMAQQKRAGVALENLAPDELARGTAEYAKNLKVISDITGQDAKKLAERAQVESMRGALAGKLTEQQNKAFQGAFQGMAKIGPEMAPKLQLALTQMLTGGAVKDPVIAGNKSIMDMLSRTTQMINSGALNTEEAFAQTTDNLIIAGKQVKASGQDMTDVANVYGSTGIVADIANFNNALRVMQGEVGEAGKSFKAATGQAGARDEVTKGYQTATQALTDFQNTMENLATKELPNYATVLSNATKKAVDTMTLAVQYLKGELTLADIEALIGEKPATPPPAAPATSNPMLAPQKPGESREHFEQRANDLRNTQDTLNRLGKAKGGISSGPVSGYSELLHGTEAVVPLPDNRSIPVSLDSSSLTNTIERNNSLLSEIARILKEGNDNTSLLVRNTA